MDGHVGKQEPRLENARRGTCRTSHLFSLPLPPNHEDWHRARASSSRSGIPASGLPVGVHHDAHVPTAAMVAIAARTTPILSRHHRAPKRQMDESTFGSACDQRGSRVSWPDVGIRNMDSHVGKQEPRLENARRGTCRTSHLFSPSLPPNHEDWHRAARRVRAFRRPVFLSACTMMRTFQRPRWLPSPLGPPQCCHSQSPGHGRTSDRCSFSLTTGVRSRAPSRVQVCQLTTHPGRYVTTPAFESCVPRSRIPLRLMRPHCSGALLRLLLCRIHDLAASAGTV